MKISFASVLLPFFLASLLLVGCGGGSGNEITSPLIRPGQFSVSQAQSIKGSQKNTSGNFDLGSLKSTQSFYFLLLNSGDMPITDVTLSSNNEAFEVYPGKIDTLSATADLTTVPIISIKAKHGQAAGTVGHVDTLPSGNLSVAINIKGKTQDAAGQIVELSHDLNLSTMVEYADIKLLFSNIERDLTKPNSSGSTIYGDGTSLRNYTGELPTIMNSGNSRLLISVFDNQGLWLDGPSFLREITLEPNGSAAIDFTGSTNNEVVIRIDTLGVVYDQERLKGHNDGYIYFCLGKQ